MSYTVSGWPTNPVAGTSYVLSFNFSPVATAGSVLLPQVPGIVWPASIPVTAGLSVVTATAVFAQGRYPAITPTHTGLGFTGDPTLPVSAASTSDGVSANRILTDALGLTGIRGVGQGVQGDELGDCLSVLNSMLDLWHTDDLTAWAESVNVITVPAGSKSITIGPTGTIIVAQRPARIEEGSYFTSGAIDYPIVEINPQQYSGIGLKTYSTIGPTTIYYEPTVPNGTLFFYPQAGSDMTLSLRLSGDMDQFPDLVTAYTLPPGYKKAITYSLAEELMILYGQPDNPRISRIAAAARKAIKRQNFSVPSERIRQPGNVYIGWET